MSSLLEEFMPHCNRLLVAGQSTIDTHSLLSRSFGANIFESVKCLLQCVISLLQNVLSGEFESSTVTIGQVWAANDNIQKLPITNKAAVRRVIMEKINLIKDTVQEFQRALDLGVDDTESNDKHSYEDGEDDDEEEDEEFDEDRYSADEVV